MIKALMMRPGSAFYRCLILLRAEFQKNICSFLFPLPFFAPLFIYCRAAGAIPVELGEAGAWAFLFTAAVLAMVYGLQCFSSESDRRTMDFLLCRPLSLYCIIAVKYVLSLLFFLGWLAAFSALLRFNLEKLPLVEGMGPEWILLVFLSIHGMSFFAGLLAKGLERFFAVFCMTGLMCLACYNIWKLSFDLAKANFYWHDIPPRIYGFIRHDILICLGLLSLATPLAGALWFLRGRVKIRMFKPARYLMGAWTGAYLLLFFATYLFSPILWPDENGKYGDWHKKAGIVLVSGNGADLRGESGERDRIYITRMHGKGRELYCGGRIDYPRFSPDGKYLVFSEDGILKLMRIHDRKTAALCRGDIADWSRDGRQIIFARRIGPKGLSRIYLYDLSGKKWKPAAEMELGISGLAWDSAGNRIYLAGYFHELMCLDLKTQKLRNYYFLEEETPRMNLGVLHPTVVLNTAENMFWVGVIYGRKLRFYSVDCGSGAVRLEEDQMDIRIQTGAPLLLHPDFSTFIYPRIDGTFVYQGTTFSGRKHHKQDR
ncbi:MAG: TolB family protein [Bacillota bacterium]